MQDRRAPLGGISKETFVNPKSDTHERELLYDVLSCIDSKILLNSQKIEAINAKCPGECIKEFDKRYLRRLYALIAGLMVAAAMCGYGLLQWKELMIILKAIP